MSKISATETFLSLYLLSLLDYTAGWMSSHQRSNFCFIKLTSSHLPNHSLTLSFFLFPVLWQVWDGGSEGAPGGSENGKLPRAVGQPLDGLAGGVPSQSRCNTRSWDGDPSGTGGPGGHRATGHGESCLSKLGATPKVMAAHSALTVWNSALYSFGFRVSSNACIYYLSTHEWNIFALKTPESCCTFNHNWWQPGGKDSYSCYGHMFQWRIQ